MAASSNNLVSILKEHGYSVTVQRRLIFELLSNQEPMTMYELYERAKGKLDRASVYRTITLFETLGIVQRINIGWKYKIELSDTFAEHHHHLTCIRCQKIIPMSEQELEGFIAGLAKSHNFVPVVHQVELQGYCEHCVLDRQMAEER